MLKLGLEAGPSFELQGQDPGSSPISPTRATIDSDDWTVAGSSRSTRGQASSDIDLWRKNLANADMDTTSRDYLTCSNMDEVTVQTIKKKYQKGYGLPVG